MRNLKIGEIYGLSSGLMGRFLSGPTFGLVSGSDSGLVAGFAGRQFETGRCLDGVRVSDNGHRATGY